MPTTRRFRRETLLIANVLLLLSRAVLAADHPRLLFQPDDVLRLQAAAGLAQGRADTPPAAHAGEWRTLQTYFSSRADEPLAGGELAAAAFVCLLDRGSPAANKCLGLVESGLRDVLGSQVDRFEQVLALDWCWDALNPDLRRDYVAEAKLRARPLALNDSPLDSRTFRDRLAALALAIAAPDDENPSSAWIDQRRMIAAGAAAWFERSFPAFLERRGLAPTSSAAGAAEESTLVLAAELADAVDPKLGWGRWKTQLGRLLEHYVLVRPSSGHEFGLMRDDSSASPLLPVRDWDSLEPLTASLLAARTADPSAVWCAQQVQAGLRNPAGRGTPSSWTAIAFDLSRLTACDEFRLPPARNLESAVVLRGQEIAGAPLLLWLETNPVYLRRGQHFDAGHFLARAGSDLVVGAGDAIVSEAIVAKGGGQHLGRDSASFDFEQFACATISHNAPVFFDPSRLIAWHGRSFLPVGGQRPQETDCRDFGLPLESDPHRTCILTAYGAGPGVTYVALDLSPAYDARCVQRVTREFLLIDGGDLLIVDRAQTGRITPTSVLNIPARPTADDQELKSTARTAGADNARGIWNCTGQRLHWRSAGAGVWLQALWPAEGRLLAVGGPGTTETVPRGVGAGRSYMGGAADSFERLILPASRPNPRNAWYRLGEPTVLGADLGKTPLWGRVEFEPPKAAERHLIVTLLSFGPAAAAAPAAATVERSDEGVRIRLVRGERQRVIELAETGPGGRVRTGTDARAAWEFPAQVQPDAAMAAGN